MSPVSSAALGGVRIVQTARSFGLADTRRSRPKGSRGHERTRGVDDRRRRSEPTTVMSIPLRPEGALQMLRSFRALFVTGLCLALAAVTTAAFAGPGDLDKTFSGDGVKPVDYAGASDTLYGVAIRKNAPTACGSSNQQATLTAFTAGGGLDKSFSGDGM